MILSSNVSMLKTSGLSIGLKGGNCIYVFLAVVYPYASCSPVVVETPQHPGNLGQYFDSLTSRICSLRFTLGLSLLLLPLLPGLPTLAWRTDCPFLVCSNFKCIWRRSSVSMSSLEKQPQFYMFSRPLFILYDSEINNRHLLVFMHWISGLRKTTQSFLLSCPGWCSLLECCFWKPQLLQNCVIELSDKWSMGKSNGRMSRWCIPEKIPFYAWAAAVSSLLLFSL